MSTDALSAALRESERIQCAATRLGVRMSNRAAAPAVPTDAAELEALLLDPKATQAVLDSGGIGDLIKNYAAASRSKDPSISDQVREGIEAGMAAFLSESRAGGATPVNLAVTKDSKASDGLAAGKGAAHNKNAPGAKADKLFDSAADFFQACWPNRDRLRNGKDLTARLGQLQEIQNSFGSTVPSDGGFLIPETLRSQILSVSLESAIVRPRATVIPMDSLRVPIPTIDSTTNQGSVFGGVVAYWTEEGAALVASSAKFGRIVLDAKKLTAYSDVPNELVSDAPAFMAVFDTIFPRAISWYEDLAFMSGSGVGEPLGWLNCDATVNIDPAVSSQVAWADVAAMYAQMLPSSLNSAVWLASPDVLPQLFAMTFGTGQFPALVPVGGGGQPFYFSLLGRPLIISEKQPALGTDGALSFVDLSYYLVGDRQVMQADTSKDYKFGNDQSSFRIIERVDGRPWLQSAITPANGSSKKLSPFVQLSGTHT